MIKILRKINLKLILKISKVELIYSSFIIFIFIGSQNIKKFIKKRKYDFKYININIFGKSDDWILGTIKKEILANRYLSYKGGYKVNFFFTLFLIAQ